MADFLLDSDVVIWHLRGRASIVRLVNELARKGRLCLSAITRAEVIQGMREPEGRATFQFLDACETLPVDARVATLGGELILLQRKHGITLALPDALIAATALGGNLQLYTCNARHYPMEGLDLRPVEP